MRGSDRFTQRASTAITKAHEAAVALGHSYFPTSEMPDNFNLIPPYRHEKLQPNGAIARKRH